MFNLNFYIFKLIYFLKWNFEKDAYFLNWFILGFVDVLFLFFALVAIMSILVLFIPVRFIPVSFIPFIFLFL